MDIRLGLGSLINKGVLGAVLSTVLATAVNAGNPGLARQKRNRHARRRSVVSLASSGFYGQNLIQFGKSSDPGKSSVNAALYGHINEKF
ncbi:MAG: hypothetical protein V4724_25330 [Pseudomonadota bacterium]